MTNQFGQRSHHTRIIKLTKSLNKNALYIAVIAAIALVMILNTSGCKQEEKTTTKKIDAINLKKDDRILVVAPHPDDETLGPGALIRRAVVDKVSVEVVIMTCGDGYKRAAQLHSETLEPTHEDYQKLGDVRHNESIEAMKQLGLESEHIKFLTYADGSTNFLFNENWDYSNLRTALTGSKTSPYSFAYEKDAPYCGANVAKNLIDIIYEYKPTIIVYPDPEDFHHDHWATSAFVNYAIAMLDYDAKTYTYLVHRGLNWPFPPLYDPGKALDPPKQLTKTDAVWLKQASTEQENIQKRKAVFSYNSQKLLMEPFLEAFIRKNELYSRYPDIKVANVKKKPDLYTYKKERGRILVDPVNDGILKKIEGVGDLKTVWFLKGLDKSWFILETTKGIKPNLIYDLSMHIFKEGGAERLDIQVLDGTPKVEMLAENSIKPSDPILVESKDKRLVVEVQSDIFDDARSMLVNVDTFKEEATPENWIDRTAWRLVDLTD